MTAGVFSAGTTPTTGPLSVKQFYTIPPVTPGNVGVCLSGGGSRALTAGMGQLRALNKLSANGQSLLAQAKALSTVPSGSWLGVPFIYLPPGSSSDTAYLGPWIEDQSTLTPATLAQLPAGNAGVPISPPLFAPKLLAVQALLLHTVLEVPQDMLWQTIIGLNILADYGLYAPTTHLTPTDTFSCNAAVMASQTTNLNPALAGEPIDLYADSTRTPTIPPGRTARSLSATAPSGSATRGLPGAPGDDPSTPQSGGAPILLQTAAEAGDEIQGEPGLFFGFEKPGLSAPKPGRTPAATAMLPA